jgi:hypothetical protein
VCSGRAVRADVEAEAREGGGRGGRANGDEARLDGRTRAAPRRIWVRASGGRGAAVPAGRSCAQGGMRATQGKSGVLRGGGPTTLRRSGTEAGRRRRRGGGRTAVAATATGGGGSVSRFRGGGGMATNAKSHWLY